MPRVEDWPSRLVTHIEAASGRPFSWGEHDCCLFAADWVVKATGIDLAAEYRGYRTRRGAYARLKRIAGGGVDAAASRALGPSIPPLMAQRGDVVSIDTDSGPALGICVGRHVAAVGKVGGLAYVPLREARKAWRV